MTQERIELNDAAAQALFAKMIERGQDLTPLMTELAPILLLSTQRRFEKETGPDGAAWAPLSKGTLRERGANAKALRKSNRLYSSVHAATDRSELVIGTSTKYAAAHQLGAEITHYARSQTQAVNSEGRFTKKRKTNRAFRRVTIGEHTVKIPARPFLGISRQDRTDIAATMREYVLGPVHEAGGQA